MSLEARPLRVRNIVVRGCVLTHESVVRNELAGLAGTQRTLGEVGDRCLEAAGALRSLGVFHSAEVLVDRAADAGAGVADAVVTVTEKKRLASASTGVHTQGGEGQMDAAVSVRNLLGRAERLDLHLEVGQQKSNSFRLSATKPRLLGQDVELCADVSGLTASHVKHSSHMEKLRGASIAVATGRPDLALGAHELRYELQLRDVCKVPTRTASWAVLQQRGVSVKSSLKHTRARARAIRRAILRAQFSARNSVPRAIPPDAPSLPRRRPASRRSTTPRRRRAAPPSASSLNSRCLRSATAGSPNTPPTRRHTCRCCRAASST